MNAMSEPIRQDRIAEVDLEHARWSEIAALSHMLTSDERLVPGYYRDPDWSVKDLIAHLGAWHAEAATQLTNIAAISYEPRDLNVDGRNADTLAAAAGEPWDTLWELAISARAHMLDQWFALRTPSDPANQWVRRAGAEHYGEHIARLRTWVRQLIDIRTRAPSDDWDS